MSPAHPIVVVGFDGTPASRAAVSHAVGRVGSDGRLIVVRSYVASDAEEPGPFHDELLETAADEAAFSLERLAGEDERLAFVDWDRKVVEGDPARAVCGVAADCLADEIVIGARGLDRLGALVGSVAGDVIHLADRPVTVIPARMLGVAGVVTDDARTGEPV